MTRRMLLQLAGLVVFVLVALQIIPVTRDNPPVTAEIHASPAVASILRRACYDCHSNETVWPWYSHVAPVSFLIANDVHHGRRHVNFSTWGTLTPAKQAKNVQDIWEEVSEGEMPMSIYVPLHHDARLSDLDKRALEAWAKSVAAENPGITADEPGHHHHEE